MIDIDKKIIEDARAIAEKDLRQCYFEGKILASLRNFSDFWARDTFWAMPGVLELGDLKIAKNSFELFLKCQKPNGLIPRKIALDYNGFKYLFKKSIKRKKPRAIYKGNIPFTDYVDGNSLMVIAFKEYLEKTSDIDFAEKNYEKIKKAVDWYEQKLEGGFIKENLLANWMDTIFKNGHVLYSNVLYCQSLESFSKVAQTIGKIEDAGYYKNKYQDLKERVMKKFWNGNFFDDVLGQHRHFDTAGNVLACYFGLASPKQAESIFKKLKEIRKELLLPTVVPGYPFWKINPILYLMGFPEYQNGISWPWIDIIACAALVKYGFKKEAAEHFKRISAIIVRNKALHETCWNDGRPFNKLLWKSAVPFAWASGLFLKVYGLIAEKKS
jgi:glycogen debranching enzyme